MRQVAGTDRLWKQQAVGNTSYTLDADLRGKVRASFYNTFAKMFGFNMKERFDPKRNKEDNLIDRIARSIEMGKL